MASFKKLPSGLVQVQVFRKGIRRSASFPTKGAAVAWAGHQESEIMAGVRGETPDLSVKELLTRYEQEVSTGKKGHRWESIRLQAIGRDRIAKVRLRQLDSPHVADWQQRRLQVVKSGSVRRERNLLNNVFEIARKEWKWLRKNPFEGVRRPKDGKPRKRTASQDEIAWLKENASENMRRAIVAALETGMRASEIASQPAVNGKVATLLDSKNGEEREVPLSAEAREALLGGIPLTAGSISADFAYLCKQGKIKGLTFHDLRHTAATRLAKKLDLYELCKMFGWKDPRHALVYYNETAANIAGKL